MSLDQLFTVAEYARCLRVAQARYGWMLHDSGFTAPEIVHELYIRLSRRSSGWDNRSHFRATCELALRHIAIDLSRSRKVSGRTVEVFEDSNLPDASSTRQDIQLEIDDALSILQSRQPRPYAVVCHRFLAGLTIEETALVLGISARTVRRDTASAIHDLRLIWNRWPQS